jgi:hypothetical protein
VVDEQCVRFTKQIAEALVAEGSAVEDVILVGFSPWKGLAFLGKSNGGCFVFSFKLHERNPRLNPFCIRYEFLELMAAGEGSVR